MMNINRTNWIPRLLIGSVLAWNLQAALVFLFRAEQVAPSFELSGVAGVAAVQGVAVLFLMWNVPYWFAVWNPVKYFLALKLALIMQAIGLIGEYLILINIPVNHLTLRDSINRFVYFDFSGLILISVAWVYMFFQKMKDDKI